MSVVVNFGGRRIIEPGVYAQTKSGTTPQSNNFPFGNIMIIDTGSGKGFGGGSGIEGELNQGLASVYAFEDPVDFRNFVRGGQIWDYSEYLFNPLVGAPSPEQIYLVKAAQTTAARINFQFTNGSISFICKNEGEVGNGFLDETLATARLILDNTTVATGDDFTLDATLPAALGGVTIQLVNALVATSNSPAEFKQAIVDEINSGTHEISASVVGQDIVLTAPRKTGLDFNTTTLVATGAISTTQVDDFAGGIDGETLILGYGATIKESEDTPNTFVIELLQGTFAGTSPSGFLYGGLKESEVKPNLLATSPEFTDMDGIINWARTDFLFNQLFQLEENFTISSGGAILVADLTTYDGVNLGEGGTEDYRPEDLDKTLDEIRELGNTFFLCDRFGDEAKSVQNMKILDHILNDSEFEKFMIVGGGIDDTKLKDDPNSSIEIAKFYDSERVIVVHSGNKRVDAINGGEERLGSIYHAANVAGRIGGLEPQEPLTFKALRLQNFLSSPGKRERERALQAGVLHNRFVPGIGNVVNQGINSLQRNTQQINPDGTSFEISIMSIGAQLNKELVLNMRPLFVGQNRGRVTPADIKSFVEGYLLNQTSTDDDNGLIIRFENVVVRLEQGYYDVRYAYVPNGPINKVFVTGFMLDTNL